MSPLLEGCPACLSHDVSVARARLWGESDLYACAACATEFLSPQPSDERLAEIYGADYYAPWGAENEEAIDQMKLLTFAPMLDAAKVGPGRSVLDLGCATGSFLAEAARRGAVPYGVDLNPEAIAVARERVPGARLHVGVAADRPFGGVLFDSVVMIDFIEHVRNPQAELDVVRELTGPGSLLVISTPRAGSVVHRASRRHWPQYREEHLTYFSGTGLRALLGRSGFTVVGVKPTRKAITLAYAYGQAIAYPVPVLSPATKVAYRVLPPVRHRAVRIPMGEMTVVARRQA
jgi:SAM-dependent methyltransferase